MSTDTDREDILSDFAMEADLSSEVLGAYIQRYPELALELTDLFHELTMVDLANAAGSTLREEDIETEQLEEGIAMVGAALSGLRLRALARRLELPRDFVAGFRDARVRVGSVPSNVLLNLARAMDVKTHYFVVYLQRRTGAAGAVAFKADTKPQEPSVVEYDDFVESLGLDDNEAVALERLAGSNGRH